MEENNQNVGGRIYCNPDFFNSANVYIMSSEISSPDGYEGFCVSDSKELGCKVLSVDGEASQSIYGLSDQKSYSYHVSIKGTGCIFIKLIGLDDIEIRQNSSEYKVEVHNMNWENISKDISLNSDKNIVGIQINFNGKLEIYNSYVETL